MERTLEPTPVMGMALACYNPAVSCNHHMFYSRPYPPLLRGAGKLVWQSKSPLSYLSYSCQLGSLLDLVTVKRKREG